MFERFTSEARVAVASAQRIARDAHANEIRPEHLLAAVLDEGSAARSVLHAVKASAEDVSAELSRQRGRYPDGLDRDDAEALASLGVDLDEVVRRLEQSMGGLGRRRPARSSPRFSAAAKAALERALQEALELRHHRIGTEHVMLALATRGDRIVADTLSAAESPTAT
jgi:ATP-dependent Clp protease ATP-binding subunit ClpA